ncbi:methyl-accepting chemotaxis protein [Dechloromonas denitrificans]|uniref:methyl-accepting chemotaxis protein n=1 Tax=Dechloromonas denitrificans TaxID=281362 RepID=UPI001CF8DC38|nr:methyl-accepting chemotaxis protein [Dechloromonas denitrificans]UCV02650.1 methyl-accepting chemotaxis protein [Dechloromonas denitrificans]UCV06949.1 methyl-accepting chemotaxis protein [Dechloromonas denitrificans]
MVDRQSIRFRVAIIVALAIVISLGCFALFLDSETRRINERDETAKLKSTNQLVLNMIAQTDATLRQQAENWSRLFTATLAGTYVLESGDTPVLKLNGAALNGNTREVDSFTQLSNGNVATVFARKGDDFVRIASSVKKEDGSRALGTPLGKQHPAYSMIRAGNSYIGWANLFGRNYMTKYSPIKDAKGEVVGLFSVGTDITSSLADLKKTVHQVKLGETGYVFVLNAKEGPAAGELLIHPVQEGKNIIGSVDGDGRSFIKEIIEKRNGVLRYPWLNKESGETRARDKIVVFNDLKELDWIVVSGSYAEEIFSLATHVRNIMLVAIVVLTILLLGVLSFFLNRIVIKPLAELVVSSRRVAEGDLTVKLATPRQDEVGKVMNAMHQMAEKLSGVIGSVRAAADTINTASQNMSTTAAEISIATERQAQSTAASAAALEEVTVSITEVSKLAKDTELSSERTSSLTNQSVTAIHQAVADIESMANDVHASSDQVSRLLIRSEEVGGIANVIRDIADQTNLLALNAAIEAARAGETGRGFAVVADEVRKLAERTAKATQEIAAEIKQIQDDTRLTVEDMQAVTPKIQSGLNKVNEVAGMLESIADEAGQSRGRAVEVADATREQAIAANDIAGSVEQVAQMTEETNVTIHSNAENAAQLQRMAAELRDQVAYFKL